MQTVADFCASLSLASGLRTHPCFPRYSSGTTKRAGNIPLGFYFELASLKPLVQRVARRLGNRILWSNFGAGQGRLATHKRNRSNDLD